MWIRSGCFVSSMDSVFPVEKGPLFGHWLLPYGQETDRYEQEERCDRHSDTREEWGGKRSVRKSGLKHGSRIHL